MSLSVEPKNKGKIMSGTDSYFDDLCDDVKKGEIKNQKSSGKVIKEIIMNNLPKWDQMKPEDEDVLENLKRKLDEFGNNNTNKVDTIEEIVKNNPTGDENELNPQNLWDEFGIIDENLEDQPIHNNGIGTNEQNNEVIVQ